MALDLGSERIIKLIIWQTSLQPGSASKHWGIDTRVSNVKPGVDAERSDGYLAPDLWERCNSENQYYLVGPSGQQSGATCECLLPYRFVYVLNRIQSSFWIGEVAVFGMVG